MDNNTRKQIIKFAKPQSWYTVLGIIFIITGILLLILIMTVPVTRRALEVSFQLIAISFVLGLILILREYILKSRVIKQLESIEFSFGHYILEDDFLNGKKYFSGSLILGKHFTFGKAMGTVIAYEDISHFYLKVYKHRFKEIFRQIKVVTKDKKTLTLCTIPATKDNSGETHLVFKNISSKNPLATYEYK